MHTTIGINKIPIKQTFNAVEPLVICNVKQYKRSSVLMVRSFVVLFIYYCYVIESFTKGHVCK